MNLDVVSAEKAYFRNTRLPWVVDRSDAFVINFRVSQPVNRTEAEPYFASSYPFYMLRHKSAAASSLSFAEQQQELEHHRAREPLTTPPLRPRGTGEDEEYLVQPLAALKKTIVAYMKESRGATLHARWAMEHVLPDTQRCLTEPDYYPIAANVEAW